MSKFKNMKIEVNEQQPIDEIVAELEKRGYKCFSRDEYCKSFVVVNSFGWYDVSRYDSDHRSITLAELKEM